MSKGQQSETALSIDVKGKHVTVTPGLRELVERKMGKVSKYFDRLDTVHVELEREPTRDAAHQNRVEVTAHVLGRTVRVVATGPEMQIAVDEAVDRLYRQLNRHKERIKSHQGAKVAEVVAPEPDLYMDPSEAEEDTTPQIVRVKSFDMKPQFEDEAVEALEDLDHTFYVFMNARTEQLNVVYKRRDGSYGLIEPAQT